VTGRDDGLLASGVHCRPQPIRHGSCEPPAAVADSGLVPPVEGEWPVTTENLIANAT